VDKKAEVLMLDENWKRLKSGHIPDSLLAGPRM